MPRKRKKKDDINPDRKESFKKIDTSWMKEGNFNLI